VSELKFLYLKQEDVIKADLFDMRKALNDIEHILKLYAEDKVFMPKKTLLDFYDNGEYRGHFVAMPVYADGDIDLIGIKWAAGYPGNPRKYNLPLGIDVIILSNPYNGVPLAIMDGTLITAVRTAALAGVAVKYLKPEKTDFLGIVGAGVIGKTLLRMLPFVVEDAKILIYDKVFEKGLEAAKESPYSPRVTAVKSLDEIIDKCDVIVTATSSNTPYFKEKYVKKGKLYVQLGVTEFEEAAVLKMDKIVVDNWEQIKGYERGTLGKLYKKNMVRDENITEIVEIISGKKIGRTNSNETIFFDTFGMACEDIAIAQRIYKTALEKNIGVWLNLWDKPLWK